MDAFEQHRPRLWAIAYRMLGSASDAEDILQEAYLRTRDVPRDGVESEQAYLSTVVTRLCLDHWKSARVRRETYVGPWLPEPVRTDEPVDPASISLAFLVLLESLTPLERAVYLLSQVFDYSHEEIARIVGRDEAACRQLLHRARAHVAAQRPRFAPSPEAHRRLLESFLDACMRGDLTRLTQLLATDATAYADGGGKVTASRRPQVGADKVAQLYTKLFRKLPADAVLTIEMLNGLPTMVMRMSGRVVGVLEIETDGAHILAVRAVANPDKLARLARDDN